MQIRVKYCCVHSPTPLERATRKMFSGPVEPVSPVFYLLLSHEEKRRRDLDSEAMWWWGTSYPYSSSIQTFRRWLFGYNLKLFNALTWVTTQESCTKLMLKTNLAWPKSLLWNFKGILLLVGILWKRKTILSYKVHIPCHYFQLRMTCISIILM